MNPGWYKRLLNKCGLNHTRLFDLLILEMKELTEEQKAELLASYDRSIPVMDYHRCILFAVEGSPGNLPDDRLRERILNVKDYYDRVINVARKKLCGN